SWSVDVHLTMLFMQLPTFPRLISLSCFLFFQKLDPESALFCCCLSFGHPATEFSVVALASFYRRLTLRAPPNIVSEIFLQGQFYGHLRTPSQRTECQCND